MQPPAPLSLPRRLEDWVDRAVRRQISRQPEASAFSLSAYAHAEGASEGAFFERALRRVTEPRLQAIIATHQADELRHERLLHECREALGLARYEVPPHLEWIDRLSDACGGILDRAIDSDLDVAQVYALLFVVEERALWEFEREAVAFRAEGDAATAAVLDAIGSDERRHLRFCATIGERMSDTATFEALVATMRPIECTVYARQSRAYARHLLGNGYLRLGWGFDGLLRIGITLGDWLDLPAPPAATNERPGDRRAIPQGRSLQPADA
jgi:hypothetical protein